MHFKRKRPRSRQVLMMSGRPRWWDIAMHTRPYRRASNKAVSDVAAGRVDPEDFAGLGHPKKPHIYWW